MKEALLILALNFNKIPGTELRAETIWHVTNALCFVNFNCLRIYTAGLN